MVALHPDLRDNTSAKDGLYGLDPESVYGYGLRMDSVSGSLPKFTCCPIVHGYICDISFMKIQIVEKNVLSRSVEESLKIPGSGSEGGRRPKFNLFLFVHRYVCGKIFVKILSVVFT